MVEKLLNAQSMLGRDSERLVEAQLMKARRVALRFRRVTLVHGQRRRFTGPPQQVRQISVRACQFGPAIHYENDLRSGLQRFAHLLVDQARELFQVAEQHAARVDQVEPAPLPYGGHADAVAGNPGLVAHDRASARRDAVEESGLPDVWSPYNHDGRALSGAHG